MYRKGKTGNKRSASSAAGGPSKRAVSARLHRPAETDSDTSYEEPNLTISEDEGSIDDDDVPLRSSRPPHSEDEDEEDEVEEDDSSQEDDGTEEDVHSSRKKKSKGSCPTTATTPPSPFEAPLERLGLASEDEGEDSKMIQKKKKKPGIVYLSSIPSGFNVSQTTMFYSQFGQVGRVFLQPDPKEKARSKDKFARRFTEGWIEFASKKVAKSVASSLNNTAVGGNKRSKAHDVLWNIKYLPRFKWSQLSERLAYERAMHQEKMRVEISQAKRQSDYFRANVEKAKKKKKHAKRSKEQGEESSRMGHRKYEFRQKETDEIMLRRTRKTSHDHQQESDEQHSPPKQVRLEQGASSALSSKSKKKGKGKGKKTSARGASAEASSSQSNARDEVLKNVFGM